MLQQQRDALVAPTAPVFDLIGQSRNTYRNKFGADGTYRGSLPAQQLNRLGELYTPEQIQAALTQAGINTTPVAPPVAPVPVAAPVVSAEVPVEVPAPVVPAEVVKPTKDPVLTEKQEEVSGFAELMAAAGEKIKGLLVRKNDSRKKKRERSTKRAAALVQFQVADPNSPKGKAYEIYEAAKANGDGIAQMLRLADKAYAVPDTSIDGRSTAGSFIGGIPRNENRFLTQGEYNMEHNPWAGGEAHDAKMALVELYLLGK